MAGRKTKEQNPEKMIIGTVTGGTLNIRKDPDITSAVIGCLQNEQKVEILEDLGEWLRIDPGFVMAKYIAK